MRSWRG